MGDIELYFSVFLRGLSIFIPGCGALDHPFPEDIAGAIARRSKGLDPNAIGAAPFSLTTRERMVPIITLIYKCAIYSNLLFGEVVLQHLIDCLPSILPGYHTYMGLEEYTYRIRNRIALSMDVKYNLANKKVRGDFGDPTEAAKRTCRAFVNFVQRQYNQNKEQLPGRAQIASSNSWDLKRKEPDIPATPPPPPPPPHGDALPSPLSSSDESLLGLDPPPPPPPVLNVSASASLGRSSKMTCNFSIKNNKITLSHQHGLGNAFPVFTKKNAITTFRGQIFSLPEPVK